MMQSVFLADDGGLVYAFSHSDFLGQAICVVLFVFSIAVWVVMINKIVTLRKCVKETERFVRQFQDKRNPLYFKEGIKNDPSPAARVFQAACERIDAFHIENPSGGRRALSNDELDVLRNSMSQMVEEQLLLFEKGSLFLATAVSGSPFLGLFGTVWGITLAFTNLAMMGRADVQTLAPGVSGALLTTVIALIVAIPSLVGYNWIGALIKNLTVRLDNFTEEVLARLKIEQLESIESSRREK